MSDAWPLSYLRTHGPAGDPVSTLQWGLLIISIVVVVAVGIALLYACLRPRTPLQPDALAGNEDGGLHWIAIGLALTIPTLLACAVWTLSTLARVIDAPAPAVVVEVRGHLWWWEVIYRNDDGSAAFRTANEIHVPVGAPVRIDLRSDDVIHSFWIPQLAGKADAIPGRSAALWLQADRDGEYRGQCAEFCGAQHAHMGLLLIAETQAAFDDWRHRQQAGSEAPATPALQRGRDRFVAACGECHAVRGTAANGEKGPELTHIAGRRTLAAALLPMNRGNLAGWIADPQALKPSALMPASSLAPDDLQAVLDYLWTLR